MKIGGDDLLQEIEHVWPKLGVYLRTALKPAIQSRGLAGQVLATPMDQPGDVQLTDLSNLVSTAGVSQIVAGTFITITPPTGKGTVTINAASGGTVTDVSLTPANGFTGTVTNPTSTPDIQINVDGTHYLPTTTDEANWNAKNGTIGLTVVIVTAALTGWCCTQVFFFFGR